jgi:hypothetical protein
MNPVQSSIEPLVVREEHRGIRNLVDLVHRSVERYPEGGDADPRQHRVQLRGGDHDHPQPVIPTDVILGWLPLSPRSRPSRRPASGTRCVPAPDATGTTARVATGSRSSRRPYQAGSATITSSP